MNVYQNTREIEAVYVKEGSEVKVTIRVAPEHPLKPLVIEFDKSVKLPEQKTKRWLLMMRSLLLNHNHNIITALVIWK
jgi:hypothetical protein